MEQQIVKIRNKKGIRVIPGFGLSMGVTLSMLTHPVRSFQDMLSVFPVPVWLLW